MHWTRRVGFICLGLVSLGLARASQGQDNIAVNDGGVVYLDDFSGSVFLSNDGGNYLLFQKVVGEGVGHENGYSRLGVRTRLWEGFDQHLFGEVHALVTDTARVGYNVGGGFRKQAAGGVLGIHAWYDDYETGQENRYRQITGGVEYLHPAFDIRSNAYVPIDKRETFIGIVDQGTDISFSGNNLVSAGTIALERAFYGWDLEGGGPVPLAQNWLRAYGGIYQLWNDGDTTTGFRARAEARFMEGVNLNLMVSEDEKYGTNVNLGVEIRFRGTMPSRFQSGYRADRRYDQVRRVWPVQTSVDNVQRGIPINNPGTSDPIQLVFIDNTNAGGTGTFEDPLTGLPTGDPDADIFLVNTGSGITSGNITLIDGQQILGAGQPHMVNTEEFGVIQLPSTFNQVSGNLPILESMTAAPIITLANDNVVSAFNLRGVNGVVGDAVNNFIINSLRSDTIMNGIVIENATGTGVIQDVDFEVMAGGTGVAVANMTPATPLNLTIDNVVIDGGENGIAIGAVGGDVNYTINNATAVNTTLGGLTFIGDGAALNGTVDNTVVNNNFGNGVVMLLDTTTGTSTFTGLQASGNGTAAMDLDGVQIIAIDNSNYIVNILNSTIDGNMDDGIDSTVGTGSMLTVFVDPTTLINSGDNAFEFTATGGSTLIATFDEVDLTGALNDAINGFVAGNSSATLNFTRFDATGAVNDGLDVIVDGDSTLMATFDNSNLLTSNGFSNSGSSAVNVVTSDGAMAILNFTNINADNMSADGAVNLIANGDSQIGSTWTNGSISNGLATAVTLAGDGTGAPLDATGTQIQAAFNNVVINQNMGDGINASLVNATQGTSFLNLDLTNVTSTGNMGDGLDYAIDGPTSTGMITLENVNLSMNTEDAFQFDVTGGAMMMTTTTSSVNPGMITNNFSNSGSNAFQGTVDGANSVAIVQIVDAPADMSGSTGALFTNTNGGTLTFDYSDTILGTNNGLQNSAEDGLLTTTTGGGTTNILLSRTSLSNNGQLNITSGDGLTGIADGNSTLNVTLDTVSATNNAQKGFNFVATDNSTIAVTPTGGAITATNNMEEGLFFNVAGGSMFSFNALGGSFSNNGAAGTFSGVRGIVDGAGTAATVSFDSSIINMNTGDGVEIDVTDGAMFVGELMTSGNIGGTLSVSQNMRAGIRLNATGIDTVAALIMDGNNFINENMEDGLIVTATGINQLAIQATGQFNMNQGGDGIRITGTDVTTSAIEVGGGVSSASGNAGDGVDITINNSSLANMMDIDVTTLTQTATVESFNVRELTANLNNGNGVSFDATNVILPDGAISDVTTNGNLGDGMGADGDGIRVLFTDSTLTNFSINGNGAELNQNNGINVELTRTDSTGLSIIDNVGATPNLGVNFLVDGSTETQPFLVTNTSAFGFDITNFNFNMAPINAGVGPVFNTTGQGSRPFTPQFGTELTTGIVSVNGDTGPDFSNAVPDLSQLLDINFNDFNPNETLAFTIDLNANSLSTSNVFGNNLIGGAVVVDFSNGSTLQGTMQAVTGNPDASTFVANSASRPDTGTRMNGENGIRVIATDSQLTDTTISGNISSENAAAGVSVSIDGALSNITNLGISSNEARMNMTDGISLTVNGVPAATGIVISGNTVIQNVEDGIDTNFTNSTVGTLEISNNFVQDSGGRGVVVDATNTPFTSVTLMDNTISNSMGGDGILIRLDTSNVGTLEINGGASSDNAGNGLNLDFIDSDITNLLVQNLNEGGVGSNIGLRFFLDGFTISAGYEIENTSDPGIDITDFFLDIATAGALWDSIEPGTSQPFEPVTALGQTLQSDVVTGLTSINGVNVVPIITPGTGTDTVDSVGTVLPGGGIADDTSIIDLTFNDFNAGETFNWLLDADFIGQPSSGVSGADLIGSTIRVDFTGGLFLTGQLQPVAGFPLASTFIASGGTPTATPGLSGNMENGLRLNLNGSTIANMTIDNNIVNGNGINGVEIISVDGALPAIGNTSVISNNTINGNDGDGIRMINPDTNGIDFTLDILNNTIQNSTNGTGVNIALNADSGQMTSEITGNTINNNASFGVRIDATDVNMALTIGDSTGTANTIDNNANAGIAITQSGTSAATISIQNTAATNNVAGNDVNFSGEGLAIELTDTATLTNLIIGDGTVGNTTFDGNTGQGIRIEAQLASTLTNPILQRFSASGNTRGGVSILRTGTATVDNVLIDFGTISNNLADGINIVASQGDLLDEYTIRNSIIDNNMGIGLSLETRGSADIMAMISNNTITNSTGDGVSLTEVMPIMPDMTTITADFDTNTISMNGGFGVDVSVAHDLSFTDNTIENNTLGGINIAAASIMAGNPIVISGASISNNGTTGAGGSGILISDTNNTLEITGVNISGNGNVANGVGDGITNLAGADTSIIGNTISRNANNGIAITNGTQIIDDNTIEMNGFSTNAAFDDGDGIQLISNDNGIGNGNLVVNQNLMSAIGNRIRSNRGRGINLLVQGDMNTGENASVTFANSRIEGNMEEGVYVVTTTSMTQGVDAPATTPLVNDGDLFANPKLVFNLDSTDVISNGIDSAFAGTGLVMRIGTSGASTAANDFEDNGGFVSDGAGTLTGRGGVLASITNSTFVGNTGADVMFESFNSTVAPAATAGTWDAANYDITTFEQDSLARLDLTFTGNSGDDIDVVRTGASFSNTEAMFKSRTTAQTEAGPFDAGNRLRNGQRLADRTGLFAPPAINTVGISGDSANFLYSGVGGSTFRITAGSDTTGFTGIRDDFMDMLQLGANTGELSFTYDLIP